MRIPGATQPARKSAPQSSVQVLFAHVSGALPMLEIGRVGVFGSRGLATARDHHSWQWRATTRNQAPSSCTLPMAKSPDKPSHPSPMHDLELVVCCTLCLHKGLLAALVVPPPPSPPILLANLPEAQQGNTTNIVMKVRLGARRKVRQSILQCRPASSSAWPHLDARLLRRVFSPSSSGKYSP